MKMNISLTRIILLAFVSLLLLPFFAPSEAYSAEESGEVYIIPIKDMITAGTASFIRRGVNEAESEGASAVVIVMDTPGGLVDATLKIHQIFRGTSLPVAVYVTPAGAIAASAGALVMLSADVTAMSPGTTVGAAQPISIAPGGEAEPAEDKTVQFLAQHFRSVATETGRPGDIAEKFVTENLTLNYEDALEQQISDYTVNSVTELLEEIDGVVVEKGGESLTFKTAGSTTKELEMNFRESFQNFVSNPQISFIFLTLGVMGIYLGLSAPGTYVPEVLGALSLVVGIYALGLFDTNTTGIVLMILGLGLITAEILTSGFGILGIGGIGSLLVGSILLPLEPLMSPDWVQAFRITVIGVVSGVGILLIVVMQRIISSRLRRKKEGALTGMPKKAVVVEELSPTGMVKLHGELWKAKTSEGGVIPVGTEVEVIDQEGLLLTVKPSG